MDPAPLASRPVSGGGEERRLAARRFLGSSGPAHGNGQYIKAFWLSCTASWEENGGLSKREASHERREMKGAGSTRC